MALSQRPGFTMHALRDLFTIDMGLMSITGLSFIIGMGVFFVRYFVRHVREDTLRAQQLARRGPSHGA
jgi:hypothetical protein